MRKRTINFTADTIFWYAIYLMPVLAYLIYLINAGATPLSFDGFLTSINLGILADNVFVNTLADIFGAGGLVPVFADNGAFIALVWFALMNLLHVFIDLILVLPRLCHKFLDKIGGKD